MTKPMPLCRFCGEVIGVYEPLIVRCEGEAQETSRAAQDGQLHGELYHRGCYAHVERPAGNGRVEQTEGASTEDSRQ
jgi:hypothetical protein